VLVLAHHHSLSDAEHPQQDHKFHQWLEKGNSQIPTHVWFFGWGGSSLTIVGFPFPRQIGLQEFTLGMGIIERLLCVA
jgi:hypothetical protein